MLLDLRYFLLHYGFRCVYYDGNSAPKQAKTTVGRVRCRGFVPKGEAMTEKSGETKRRSNGGVMPLAVPALPAVPLLLAVSMAVILCCTQEWQSRR